MFDQLLRPYNIDKLFCGDLRKLVHFLVPFLYKNLDLFSLYVHGPSNFFDFIRLKIHQLKDCSNLSSESCQCEYLGILGYTFVQNFLNKHVSDIWLLAEPGFANTYLFYCEYILVSSRVFRSRSIQVGTCFINNITLGLLSFRNTITLLKHELMLVSNSVC